MMRGDGTGFGKQGVGARRLAGGHVDRRALLQWAAVGSTAALAGCGSAIKMDPQGWATRLGTTYALPRWQWAPRSACDIVAGVQRAESEGRRIRMTGSGFSFSDVAVNDDWLLSPRLLTQIFFDEGCCLRPGVAAEGLVRVQAGVTVKALNAALDEKGLGLFNMGGYDGQTFVGAASTGTHGSGFGSDYGPLATQIVSIQVVGPGGKLLQVEPDDGITNPDTFTKRLRERPDVEVELRRDTRLFDALAVSLGCLGVIYAVTFRAARKFWLIERRTMTTWEALARKDGVVDCILAGKPLAPVLPDPSPLAVPACIPPVGADPEHVEINFTPYPDKNGEHVALLTLRWRTQCEPPSVGGTRGAWGFHFIQELGLLADEAGADLAKQLSSTAKTQADHVTGMKLMSQKYYANRSDIVFQLGILDDLHVYGIELHFDACKTKAVVARHLEEAAHLAESGMFHSSPPTLRFVSQASPLLSMQNGRPKSVALEFGMFTEAYGAEELLCRYEDIFVGGEYGGRPHWGLDRNHITHECVARELYGTAWDEFKLALAELNPTGTFDGRVTDRLGISYPRAGAAAR